MKNLTKTLLASAMLAALPMGSALACTTGAWSGTTGAPVAGNPTSGDADGVVARYSGNCALQPAAGGASFVSDASPASEGVYRARFYVFTGSPGGAVTIFRATGGAAVERFAVSYNPAGSFNFTNAGAAAGSVSGVLPSRWYSIEFNYDADGASTATVSGAAKTTNAASVALGTGTGTVDDANLGAINATSNANTLKFDEFESTRGTAAIGRLVRGDANQDGGVSGPDIVLVAREASNLGLAVGQPDCNEDGGVSGPDIVCVARIASGLDTP